MRKARKAVRTTTAQRKEQKRSDSGSTKRGQNLLCFADGHISSQESGVGTEISEMPRPGLHSEVTQWKTIQAPFLCSQSKFASQMTAAKVMDVIARLPGGAGQPACVVSAYKYQMDDAPKLRRNPIVRVSRFVGSVFHDSKMAKLMIKHRRSRGSSRTKLVRTPICWPLLGMAVRKSSIGSFLSGKKFRIGNVCSFTKTKIVLIGIRG